MQLLKVKMNKIPYYLRYILAFITSAVVTISVAAAFVMHFNDVNTWLGCALVLLGWIAIMLIVGGIMSRLTHKIFDL